MNYITTSLKDNMFPQGDFHKETMSNQTAKDWLHSHELIALRWKNDDPYYNSLYRKFGIHIVNFSLSSRLVLEMNDAVLVFTTNLPCIDSSEIYSDKDLENAEFTFNLYTII